MGQANQLEVMSNQVCTRLQTVGSSVAPHHIHTASIVVPAAAERHQQPQYGFLLLIGHVPLHAIYTLAVPSYVS